MATKGDFAIETKGLVAKLAEACDAVKGVSKEGRNEIQKYNYVKAADVAKAIRHELFSRGIVIIPDEVACEFTEWQTMKGSVMKECRLRTAYTITDGSETLVMHGYGVAMDSGDKAIYKAKTGALKYFLRGLGLIPDEKDDPEADGDVDVETRIDNAVANVAGKIEAQERIAAFQVKALEEAYRNHGWSVPQVAEYLSTLNNYVQLEEVTKGEFQAVLKAFNQARPIPEDMTEALAKSVKQAAGDKCVACGGRMFDSKFKKGEKYCGNKECPTRQKKQRVERAPEPEPIYDENVPF